jgi:segregation and condensation protein A
LTPAGSHSQSPSPGSQSKLLPVKLAVFEGPLDLLLHLIERNELDISAVSLVLVVEQYMQYLDLMRAEMKLEAAAEFLVVAGRLLLIKSRSLLPQPEPVGEMDEMDPAEELVRQLEEYRQFKQIAEQLRQLKETRGPEFVRAAGAPDDIPPVVKLVGLDVDRLIDSFRLAMVRAREQQPEDAALELTPRVTQGDRIAAIESGLSESRTLPFERLLADCHCVEDVIVTFLAVLELLKQARIRVWQMASFGPIVISRPAKTTSSA